MNICMVLMGGFPTDVRVSKEAKSLLSAGHKITLLALGKPNQPKIEEVQGILVIRMQPSSNKIGRLLKTMGSSIFFDNSTWRKTLDEVVMENNIDVLHCHDLNTVNLGRKVAKRHRIPIIADLHENFPEAIAIWRKGRTSGNMWFYLRLIYPLPIRIFKRFERSALQKVDRIITVVDEAKEHYVNDCGISSDKVTVVMNTEDLDDFDNMKVNRDLIAKFQSDFTITYIGNFGPHRGIETAIRATAFIKNKVPNARLILVGKGPEGYTAYLKRMCRELYIEKNVEFTGWVDFNDIPSYIELSDICLVPHNANGHTNTTIPHKLFQYMAKRKPVIVTDCAPLKRIVNECRCGIVIPSGDYKDMARAVMDLYQDSALRNEMGEKGRKAVEGKYSWENAGAKLLGLYRSIGDEVIASNK